MKITLIMKTSILVLAIMFFSVAGAVDLPTKGKSAPTPVVVMGPGGLPADPGVPTGDGICIILALTSLYVITKRKTLKSICLYF